MGPDELSTDMKRGADIARNSIVHAFLKYDDFRGAETVRNAPIMPGLETGSPPKPDLSSGLEALVAKIMQLEDMISSDKDELFSAHLERATDQIEHYTEALALVIGTTNHSDTHKRALKAYRKRVRGAQL